MAEGEPAGGDEHGDRALIEEPDNGELPSPGEDDERGGEGEPGAEAGGDGDGTKGGPEGDERHPEDSSVPHAAAKRLVEGHRRPIIRPSVSGDGG